MADSYRIFDRALVRRRADAKHKDALYLFEAGARGLADKLNDINRHFKRVLAIGPGLSPEMLGQKPEAFVATGAKADVAFDEEQLPFTEGAFDLVLSNLTFHWVNDLPGTLVQIRRILRPDGLFLGVLFGGETLKELRESLLVAETETEGGASPRVAPFADVRDAGDLLQRAGFAMPVADAETLTASYGDPLALMKELRAMGEANAMLERRKAFTRRAARPLPAATRWPRRPHTTTRLIVTRKAGCPPPSSSCTSPAGPPRRTSPSP